MQPSYMTIIIPLLMILRMKTMIRADPGVDDLRRYNRPTVNNEVAILLPMDLSEQSPEGSSRDIVLHAREMTTP